MSVPKIHPCQGRGCDGAVIEFYDGVQHVTRDEGDELMRALQIELDHEHQARAMGGA